MLGQHGETVLNFVSFKNFAFNLFQHMREADFARSSNHQSQSHFVGHLFWSYMRTAYVALSIYFRVLVIYICCVVAFLICWF